MSLCVLECTICICSHVYVLYHLSQICLQQWIDEKQKMASSVVVSCPQCQFPYQVKYPSTNVFLLVYEYMERGISFCSPMILAGVTATALYWCSFTYGITSAVLAMGKEESLEYFGHSNESSVVVVLLPLLPWVIFAVKFSRPEVLILKVWYRFLAPLMALALKPLAISTYNYFPTQRSFPSSQINIVHHLSRCVLSTAFLPVIASIIGHLLFSPVKGNLKKTLMVIKQLLYKVVCTNLSEKVAILVIKSCPFSVVSLFK